LFPSRTSRTPLRDSFWALCVCLLLLASACTGEEGPPGAPAGSLTFDEMADRLGTDVMRLVERGYVPGRSGEIVLVPEPWNVVGQWNGGLRGPEDPRTTHATPWAYHARVPIILWGPGYVRGGVRSNRSVDVAGIAPTTAELLGLDLEASGGRTLHEALVPSSKRPDPPRVILTIAYDGGGWNVLDEWPDAWPVGRRLARRGSVFLNGTIGSAPSVTAPVHLNMGTGVYPEEHGIPENTARLPDGSVSEIFFHEADPRLVQAETVADVWDRSRDNGAWVGLVGFESWHLGMIGSGARIPGGDRDVAVLWEREEGWFWTNPDVYSLPSSLPTRDLFADLVDDLDVEDGARDRLWLGNSLDNAFFLPGTPAFVDLQGEVIMEMLRTEPIGTDGITDLLALELKSSDYGGHVWNMTSPEAAAVLRSQDELVGRIVGELDRRVGRGNYVVVLTADHGQTPVPSTTGGLRVDRYRMEAAIEEFFGADVVEDGGVHPSEIFLKMDRVREAGVSVDDVARYVGDLRYGDALPEGLGPGDVPEVLLDRRVIAAALPGSYLTELSEGEIDGLGEASWPEGDLTSPPGYESLLG
jgi:predicted AlkP superfamily pyrophosphatase or phosphodiesterase